MWRRGLTVGLCVQISLANASNAGLASQPSRIRSLSFAWSSQALAASATQVVHPTLAQTKVVALRSAPLPVRTDTLSAQEERRVLLQVARELRQELSVPGSSQLPLIAVISDQHGTDIKFLALILDAIRQALPDSTLIPIGYQLDPARTIASQLLELGISVERDLAGRLFFHNLGDLVDRGQKPLSVIDVTEELIGLGLSSYVIGNHDLLAMLCALGFHLPSYSGYRFYGYRDRLGLVAEEHARRLQSEPELAGNPHWWAEKIAIFMEYKAQRQKNDWSQVEAQVNGPIGEDGKRVKGKGLFAEVSASLKTKEEQRIWGRFRGNMFKTDAEMGVRAVGSMSINWWIDLLGEFEKAYSEGKSRHEIAAGSPADHAWNEAMKIMKYRIIPALQDDFEAHLAAGEWWWRMIEAINAQNNRSTEWSAMHWLFHAKWGPYLLAHLNAVRGPDEASVTAANYLRHPAIRRIADFYRDHFNLYVRDIFQNTYMHAFLPMDPQTAEFHFTYKGMEYRGKGSEEHPSVWSGLERIAADIRNRDHSLFDLMEALTLVNSWYADETTQIKFENVAGMINRFGPDGLASANGFNLLGTGHLPFFEFYTKLTEEQRGAIGGFLVDTVFFTDHGMGERYQNRGAMVLISVLRGLWLRGWRSKDRALADIEDHPPTAESAAEHATLYFQNAGMERAPFLEKFAQYLRQRIQSLRYAAGLEPSAPGLRNPGQPASGSLSLTSPYPTATAA